MRVHWVLVTSFIAESAYSEKDMQTNKNRYSLVVPSCIEESNLLDVALFPVPVWFRPPWFAVCTLQRVMKESQFRPHVITVSKTHLSN